MSLFKFTSRLEKLWHVVRMDSSLLFVGVSFDPLQIAVKLSSDIVPGFQCGPSYIYIFPSSHFQEVSAASNERLSH